MNDAHTTVGLNNWFEQVVSRWGQYNWFPGQEMFKQKQLVSDNDTRSTGFICGEYTEQLVS
jgi:hypothetical protein